MSDAATPTPAAAGGRAGMKKELPEHFKAYRHVWVFVEYEHGAIHPVSLELLGEGRKLADKLGVELAGVLLGSDRDALAAATVEVSEYGADLVYLVADPILEHYRNEPFTNAVTDLVNTYKPEILLLGATVLGRDLAGSVATTLADRPDGGLHRTGDRRRTLARGDAADLRRVVAMHDPYVELPAADGDGAAARAAHAGAPAGPYRACDRACAGPAGRGYRHQGTALPAGSRFGEVAVGVCRHRRGRRAWACGRRKICNWFARWRMCWAASGAVRGLWCRRAG